MGRIRGIVVPLALGVLLVSSGAEAEEIRFPPGQTDQFAGAMCPLRIDKLAGGARDQIEWRLTSGHRTLADGRVALTPVEAHPDSFQFVIPTPEIENGVVLETKLTLAIEGIESPAAVPLRLRGKNPFESVRKTLGESGIAVWDPAGTTGRRLAELGLPLRELKSLGAAADSVIVILGEEARWAADTPAVAGELVNQGKLVVVLRPQADSAWPLTLSAAGLSQFRSLHWPGSGFAPSSLDIHSLGLAGDTRPGWGFAVSRQSFQLIPENSPQVWDLVESQSQNHGRCLWVGAALMSRWELSPVSRELLAHILISRLDQLSAAKTADPE